jgi:spore germination protein YaaH
MQPSDEEPTLMKSEVDQADAGTPGRPSNLVVAGFLVVLVLFITGLFLPPISLGQRLGLASSVEQVVSTAQPTSESNLSIPGEIALSLSDAETTGVDVSSVTRTDFLNSDADEEWAQAAAAIPSNRTLESAVYLIKYEDPAPMGQAALALPSAPDGTQTLDLVGWNGEAWAFVPSRIDSGDQQIVSLEGPLPRALAFMQTAPPDTLSVGAALLSRQELPTAVLPHLTEVTVGTLTLAEDGTLGGDLAEMPTGAYDQLLRVTNTGVIIDQASLAALLDDAAAQTEQVDTLVQKAVSDGYAGVNLDYQGVSADQRNAYTSFVGNLADALHEEDLTLATTLATPRKINGNWDSGGQDWAALGQIADTVYVQMPLDPTAYGEDGSAEQLLDWTTHQIDRHKVMMSVSANAVDKIGESFLELPNEEALKNFGELQFVEGGAEVEPETAVAVALSGTATALEWDGASLTYKYSYQNSDQTHQVWLGNAAALGHRLRLANQYNLRGVVVRGLGNVVSDASVYATALEGYVGTAEAPQTTGAAIVWTVRDEGDSVLASDSGDDLTYSWAGVEEPGHYSISAEFAMGDNVANLGSVDVAVVAPPEAEETVAEEETETEEVEETTDETDSSTSTRSFDPGDADAVVNVNANVRVGPGLSYGLVSGGLTAGSKVSLLGRNEEATWFNILMSDGDMEGWIYGTLITVNSAVDVNALQVVEVEEQVASNDDNGGNNGGAAPAPVAAPPVTNPGFELGGQTHTFANPTLMASVGMNWVKFQHKWSPGNSPDVVAGRIQQAHANGFKVLLSIPGANTYPDSIDFKAYTDFLGGVAALGPDAIEVWNEMNIDFEWPAGQIDPASYVNNMLAPAYNAIKAANPNVMVVGGAPAPTGFDNGTNAWADDRYMAGVAAAGGHRDVLDD